MILMEELMMSLTKRLLRLWYQFYTLDKTIVVVLLALAGINIVVQFSANDDIFQHVINDIIYLVISFMLLFVFANISMGQLKHLAIPCYILSVAFLLAVLFIGVKLHRSQER